MVTQAEIDEQGRLFEEFEIMAKLTIEKAAGLWGIGDGYGGYVINTLMHEAEKLGLPWGVPRPVPTGKNKTVKKNVLLQVIARDGFKCVYCKADIEPVKLTLDHRVPLILGGQSTLENLCVCCKTCNSRKGDRLMSPLP